MNKTNPQAAYIAPVVEEDPYLRRIVQWGIDHPDIRALVMTSSRASPIAPLDALSDYDIVVVVTEIAPFLRDDAWLNQFAPVLVVYRDPLRERYGMPTFYRITQYEETKIDYGVWPVEGFRRMAADPLLPSEFDVGYQVLLDKDGLTQGLQPPTYRAHITQPPTEPEYREVIELFFHNGTYVAKLIWRDELMPVKSALDEGMKQMDLRRMLEWRAAMDHNWSIKAGAYGRGLKKYLPPDLWAELEATYVGADMDENWEAFQATIRFFRKVALQVGERLGYTYPHEMDARMLAYFEKVRHLPK